MKKISLRKIIFLFFAAVAIATGLIILALSNCLIDGSLTSLIQPKTFIFFGVGAAALILFIYILSFFLVELIKKPLTELVWKSKKNSQLDFTRGDSSFTRVVELSQAIESFDQMTEKLAKQKSGFQPSSEKLLDMNKRYLDLIGFVSHELKGILSSIILNTYNLKNEIFGPMNLAQKKTLASISRNLDYLNNTVRNFLSLSRIEKGQMELNKTAIDLRLEVVEASLEAFAQWVDERNIKVDNKINEKLIVEADLGLIQVVMNNLVSNAIKYGVEGGSLVIDKKILGELVEIEIYNDGKPIEQVDLDKLFQKFSRLLYRGTERIKGTGIGLFISKEVVKAHGGDIWVEPKKNGNSFKFTIRVN